LDDLHTIEHTLLEVVKVLKVHLLHSYFHKFAPQGVSGCIIIEESHISVHTWPELGYAAIDVFTCGLVDPSSVVEFLKKELCAKRVSSKLLVRGPGEIK